VNPNLLLSTSISHSMMFNKNAGHGGFEILRPGAKYKRVLLSVCTSNDDEQFDSEFD
jgi:hypothetical protein